MQLPTEHMTNVILFRVRNIDKYAKIDNNGCIKYNLYDFNNKTSTRKVLTPNVIRKIFSEVFE